MTGVAPVGKAGVLVSRDEPAHLRQSGGILLVAQVPPLCQPRLEADPHRSQRLPLGPACNPQPGSQFPGSGHQRKPVDGPTYLITGTLRGQFGGKALDLARQVRAVLFHVGGQYLHKGAEGGAVLVVCVGLERIGKGAPTAHAMQPLKRAVLPGVARDLDSAHLHSRLSTLPGTGGMILK
ncbi:hypothetical protein D3C77_461040 [compost metagenome]